MATPKPVNATQDNKSTPAFPPTAYAGPTPRTRKRKTVHPVVAEQLAKVAEAKVLGEILTSVETLSLWALDEVTKAISARRDVIGTNPLPDLR